MNSVPNTSVTEEELRAQIPTWASVEDSRIEVDPETSEWMTFWKKSISETGGQEVHIEQLIASPDVSTTICITGSVAQDIVDIASPAEARAFARALLKAADMLQEILEGPADLIVSDSYTGNMQPGDTDHFFRMTSRGHTDVRRVGQEDPHGARWMERGNKWTWDTASFENLGKMTCMRTEDGKTYLKAVN